jgi:L-threonylcarbamoyladenylate synthase
MSVGVILPTGWPLPPATQTILEPWAPWDDIPALSARIFAALRSLDDQGATVILCPLPAPTEQTDALRDRLQKAARPT